MTDIICDWDLSGVEAWRGRAAVFVIVDVLSFSTAVSVAVDRGACVLPFPFDDTRAVQAEAARRGAIAAAPRRACGGGFSLSPASLSALPAGARLLLPSPNGSRLSLETGGTPTLCGCLRNATAGARAAVDLAGGGTIAVIAAGEHWPNGAFRPAIEDWLGAGAVIAAAACDELAEATLARTAFQAAGADVSALIRGSMSGRELIDGGFAADVDIALERDTSPRAPLLSDAGYRAA